ncbi:DNA-binding response OmpR family regulator [Mumia flava]|uniref:DNA-binding response OmpR family regulator n=1 Tax=Mumia flava TaxID=1348852 RepID=A0A0B2BLV7_9ACTN|nr:response regulator transcription factor [Mumia flava]PJJ56211.1 DNA-binding response OmpR family regulator [Mumia flava]
MEAAATAHVLVIEDDPSVRDVVRRYLEHDGHRVTVAVDGESGLRTALDDAPDLVVLDLMLPGIDGIEVCRRLRADPARGTTPVVMLTALVEEERRIAGLTVGADDYVTKPFSAKELALRVRAVLRRTAGSAADPGAAPAPSPMRDGDLVLDPAARTAELGGEPLALTAREFDLLAFLLARPGQVFSRADLLAQVWGWSFGDHSTVTVHVKRLRHKIEEVPAEPRRIVTVYGVGYRYDREADGEREREGVGDGVG